MNTFLFLSLISLSLALVIYLVDRKINKKSSVDTDDHHDHENIVKPEKAAKPKNEQLNFHKAAIKARRQGHLRFVYHGNYYTTGLNTVDGTGK